VGVTDTSLRRVFGYLDMAHELGADGVVVMPQFYYLTNQPELLTFFRTIKERSPLPVIAYNIPSMVKVGIEAATLAQLAQEGAICAIKDSSGDLSATRDMLMQVRAVSDVTVLTGLEFVVDSAIAMGMHGSVPGLGNVAPRAYVDVYELGKAGDLAAAGKVQEQLVTLFKIIRQARSGQSFSDSALGGFKAALKVLGVIKTSRMHAPWQGLNEAETEAVKAVMRESGLF
jgi:4-hydroxy-tetrahydrodipicolinate synthase